MNENVVRRFKQRGAEYYRETRKNILAGMVKGNLIHADETRIRLHAKSAYVWVFVTFREVVYFYSGEFRLHSGRGSPERSLFPSRRDAFRALLAVKGSLRRA